MNQEKSCADVPHVAEKAIGKRAGNWPLVIGKADDRQDAKGHKELHSAKIDFVEHAAVPSVKKFCEYKGQNHSQINPHSLLLPDLSFAAEEKKAKITSYSKINQTKYGRNIIKPVNKSGKVRRDGRIECGLRDHRGSKLTCTTKGKGNHD